MPKGLLSLVLHAHLPFVRHPEHEEFLEEDWLYEAITEVYLPLLGALTRLRDAGARPRLAMSISPTLCEMLADPLLRSRYARHLDNLRALARKEVERTAREAPEFHAAALHCDARLREAARLWDEVFARDLVRAFAALQADGVVEINTCAATHAYLPLVSTVEARRAQIVVAVANYRKHFGRRPRGIWLPECAYAEGLEHPLAEAGLEYFFADTHAVLYGEPRPRFGVHAPVRLPNGVAAFARDVETGEQVWSARGGYPGDPFYREFYRDLGWDAPLEYILPHLHRDGRRRPLGLKYHRVTGRDVPLSGKEPYDPGRAGERAREHARHFVASRVGQAERLGGLFGGALVPLVVSPYDAELFGHWWHEGPDFLEHVFRRLDARREEIAPVTPGDYLDAAPQLQTLRLSQSSWGEGGYSKVWLSEPNAWLYPRQHAAEARMTELADRFAPLAMRGGAGDLISRALNQAARELLLAQSSDWAFQIYQGTTAAYAAARFNAHVGRFDGLAASIERGAVDRGLLEEAEGRDNLFPEIDFRAYSSGGSVTT